MQHHWRLERRGSRHELAWPARVQPAWILRGCMTSSESARLRLSLNQLHCLVRSKRLRRLGRPDADDGRNAAQLDPSLVCNKH